MSGGLSSVIAEARAVRVRFSTVFNYLSHMYRLALALGFTVIVARRLSIPDYGLYIMIMGLVNIVSSIYMLWCYWVPRFYARGRRDVASAALTLNIMYAPIGYAVIALTGLYYISRIGGSLDIFLIAGLLTVLDAINYYLMFLSRGTRPYVEGGANIVRSTVRLALAYILIVTLHMGLYGAYTAAIIALASACITYYIMLRISGVSIPPPTLNTSHLRILVMNMYIPLLACLNMMMLYFERPLITLITASTIATAYLGVSYIPRMLIMQGGSAFSSSLMARLLRIPCRRDVEDVLRISTFINLCAASIMITLSKPILTMFRPEYGNASILFTLFVVEAVIVVYASIFAATATSLERRDLYESGAALTSTVLFRIPLSWFLRSSISIIAGSLLAYAMVSTGVSDPILIALPYPILWLATSIPLAAFIYREARRKIDFGIPVREILAGIVAGGISSTMLIITGLPWFEVRRFWTDILWLALGVVGAAVIYALVFYTLSPWFRGFVRASMKFLSGRGM